MCVLLIEDCCVLLKEDLIEEVSTTELCRLLRASRRSVCWGAAFETAGVAPQHGSAGRGAPCGEAAKHARNHAELELNSKHHARNAARTKAQRNWGKRGANRRGRTGDKRGGQATSGENRRRAGNRRRSRGEPRCSAPAAPEEFAGRPVPEANACRERTRAGSERVPEANACRKRTRAGSERVPEANARRKRTRAGSERVPGASACRKKGARRQPEICLSSAEAWFADVAQAVSDTAARGAGSGCQLGVPGSGHRLVLKVTPR